VRSAVLISAILLGSVIPAAAGQGPVKNPQANAHLGALRSARPDPYEKLFQPREALKAAIAAERAASAPATRIVCGMTMIVPDQNIDPKMAVTRPADDKLRYTIRAIEPPICNPAK
jgi:hypothetical protein